MDSQSNRRKLDFTEQFRGYMNPTSDRLKKAVKSIAIPPELASTICGRLHEEQRETENGAGLGAHTA